MKNPVKSSPIQRELIVENPFTGQKVDMYPLFKHLNILHSMTNEDENFVLIGKELIEANTQLNIAASQACKSCDVYEADSALDAGFTLTNLAMVFLSMTSIKPQSIQVQ